MIDFADAINYINTLSKEHKSFVFVINYKKTKVYVWETHAIPPHVKIQFPHFKNDYSTPSTHIIDFKARPITREAYKNIFYLAQKKIAQSNTTVINLTSETALDTTASLYDIFLASSAKYKLYIENEFVVFSPEIFIQIHNDTIQTFPMKGTINAEIESAEQIILQNKKEAEEHASVVQLMQNDLQTIANNVSINRYRYIDTIHTQNSTLLQVSSELSGNIKPEFSQLYGSILDSLLPAGSICGSPKQNSIDIIKNVENHKRNFYTGVMGYAHKGFLESAVMIRFIEQRDNKLYYKSGGGITKDSNLEHEYNELIQKIYVPTYRNSTD